MDRIDLLEAMFARVSYDPESGVIRWVATAGKKRKPGDIANARDAAGYVVVRYRMGNRVIHARGHQIAWRATYGNWPTRVDHKNGDRGDNRIENLRIASASQNAMNSKYRGGKSGVKGVCWFKPAKLWMAYIDAGRRIHIGYFKTIEEAAAARRAAEKQYHGEFAHSAAGAE